MPPSNHDRFSIFIRAAGRRELDERLDRAVEHAIGRAFNRPEPGLGILVSRHDHRTVTVELTDQVEPGTIIERDLRELIASAAVPTVQPR
jgi:hypothetical protein